MTENMYAALGAATFLGFWVLTFINLAWLAVPILSTTLLFSIEWKP